MLKGSNRPHQFIKISKQATKLGIKNMSGHIIYIWDATNHGQPQSFDEAVTTFQKLIKEIPEQPTSAMLAFAQRIQDIIRFGSNTDEELRRLYGNFVDKVKQHPFALLAVELPYNNYLPVMRMIVETATALQLVSYDDQQGLVFLPSGDIFPESRAEIWLGALAHLDSNKDFPKNVKAFETYVKPMLEEMMIRHGFIKKHIPKQKYDSKAQGMVEVQTPIYSKLIPIGECYVSLNYAKGRHGYGIPASLHIKYDPVDVIYNRFGFVNTDSYSTFHIQLLIDLLLEKEMPNKSFEMNNHQDILDRLTLMEKTIFPFFSTLHDLKSLDNLVNGHVNTRFTSAMQGRGVYAPRCLIVARLANNPRFEELAVTLAKPRSPGANEDVLPTEWPKLVQYLREGVKPLV